MKKIKYVGSHDEVEIGETGLLCKRGESVEVPDELAESLLEQPSNWEPVKATTTKNKEA
ncbi:MAG TPA: hypothetical protein VEX15_18415 [Nocardioidaceae bacterium]|nr:hypothetical protein [Nocardioidaceae bacterium]